MRKALPSKTQWVNFYGSFWNNFFLIPFFFDVFRMTLWIVAVHNTLICLLFIWNFDGGNYRTHLTHSSITFLLFLQTSISTAKISLNYGRTCLFKNLITIIYSTPHYYQTKLKNIKKIFEQLFKLNIFWLMTKKGIHMK